MLDAGTLTGVSLKCEDPHKTRIDRGQTGCVERAVSREQLTVPVCVCHNVDIVTS